MGRNVWFGTLGECDKEEVHATVVEFRKRQVVRIGRENLERVLRKNARV